MGLRVGDERQDSKSLASYPGQGGTPGRRIKDPASPNLGKPEIGKDPRKQEDSGVERLAVVRKAGQKLRSRELLYLEPGQGREKWLPP